MKINKDRFSISSLDDKGATRSLMIPVRVLSVDLVDKLARVESEIPTIRKRARGVFETLKQFEKQAQREGISFEECLMKAMKDSPLVEPLLMAYEGRYTIADLEDSMSDHAANIQRTLNAKRVEVLRIVADRRKMGAEDLALLDSPFDAQMVEYVPAVDDLGEPIMNDDGVQVKNKTVVDVDNSFWANANAGELSEAADFFRSYVKNGA